jgi:dTDP-4-dehydrorhamnose reductase
MNGELELWGGPECTLNRVGDDYFDQFRFSGHATRLNDLDRFAALGLRTLRYPIGWERVAPEDPRRCDWRWTDERLERLHRLKLDPIVGLLHHGSGPRYTDLSDPDFPEKLAEFAGRVAARYPWVMRYTPVNEPLTTARFSGLYGHWYPHQADDLSFLRMLLNQCRGTALAMRAIRAIQPEAQLILTEDIGSVESTLQLAAQAAFENERRWLSMDLLMGRVTRSHPLYRWLTDVGVSPEELELFAKDPCPPDIFGINHYLTSNRFLDERLERYPASTHGGNGRQAYADVEAVRVAEAQSPRRAALLRAAWERFHRPLAITECHLHCTREEQLRWLAEAWTDAQQVRREGVDMRAVTAWSLLGTFDWVCLVTRCDGVYEAGAFDLRAPAPRPTALAQMVQALATDGTFAHPVLEQPGWWVRPTRVAHPPLAKAPSFHVRLGEPSSSSPILITGGHGTLAHAFVQACELRGLPYMLVARQDLEASDATRVNALMDELRPWAVVNAAGYVRVDAAEDDVLACRRDNTEAPAVLAAACAQRRLRFLSFSSDLVFDGAQGAAYHEHHAPNPLNVYGLTKAAAESRIKAAYPDALVIRTSAFFGPWDAHNFVTLALRALERGEPFIAAEDVVITPTYVPELSNVALDLLMDGEGGLWHLAHPEALSWADFGRRAAQHAGLDSSLIEGRRASEMGWRAPRPRNSALASSRGTLMGSLDAALDHYLSHRRTLGAALPAAEAAVLNRSTS